MILSILKGAICLSGITGLIFAIIVLATGIAPMGALGCTPSEATGNTNLNGFKWLQIIQNSMKNY